MIDLQKVFYNYLQGSYLQKEVCKNGISLGFLATIMDANIEEYIDDMLKLATEVGEFGCPKCDNYYTANEAKVDNEGCLLCPQCGAKLTSSWCDGCGQDIRYEVPMLDKNGRIICQHCSQ
ncbi:hypothetical protein MTAT_19100 [Moorella thermoacetica]|uniref:Uncharacterized protein n=1 Tax=Neomoorella thermoacetica TaxID=1525 RepID=A0AAC9HI43_NEOTH|nr:hypothetical protein [Moorella thermoacetica]AOQ24567.1 hypothetical protein Maut_02137 [Moorella thermoacetica]TYL12668.1 hypothetical protein MTAT_19100 [Moorella thermoacetica]